MPGGDGTGPMGRGRFAGRGSGYGRMFGCGCGKRYCLSETADNNVSKEALQRRKELLEIRLGTVNKQLGNP
jgi:hypothetical protein